jgi:hypothetical protein
MRVARRADWPAVDSGRVYAREKAAVIGCVAADPSAVAFLEVEHWRLLQGHRFIIRGRGAIPASFLATESDFGEFAALSQCSRAPLERDGAHRDFE